MFNNSSAYLRLNTVTDRVRMELVVFSSSATVHVCYAKTGRTTVGLQRSRSYGHKPTLIGLGVCVLPTPPEQ